MPAATLRTWFTRTTTASGQFTAPTTVNGHTVTTTFIVIDAPGEILLGHSSSQIFGLLAPSLEAHHVAPAPDEEFRDYLQRRYPAVFNGVGKLRDYQATIHVDSSVPPVAQRPRRVPFALRSTVRDHLKDLMEKDIIEKVDGPSPWVSPVVVTPKPNGDIRLCVDMRRANEAIIRERHPIPTIDEVLERLNGSTVFSKIDLRWGFHQVELDEASRAITTVALDENLYRYKRMMFGITSAPEKYQNIVAQVISGCNGTLNIADDLIVHGQNQTAHDENLFRLLERLEEKGLTVGLPKCRFRQPHVEFYGLRLGSHGVEPTAEKVNAITNAPRPSNASEVRSFLGLVGFSARFIPQLSTIAEPLRRVTHKGTPFSWGPDQQNAFDQLKQRLAEATTLAYFDRNAPTQVIADASPVGVGAVIVQHQNGVRRPICYASRTLTSVERRYSQTEKEALSLVWACERFHQYLYGLEFELVTDHKPLEVIYSARSKPSARIERWVPRLQPYRFRVVHIAGPNNIADALSRLPVDSPDDTFTTTLTEESVRLVTRMAAPVALNIRDIERASANDEELRSVTKALHSGNTADMPRPYLSVRHELTSVGCIVLRGTRIVPPASLRDEIVDLAHEGHQGIVKTKERLRTKIWWPGMDRSAEQKCKTCYGCQVVSQLSPPPPVKSTPLPDAPWQHLATDLLGPLPSGETLLVTVDYFSRYFEVDVLHTTTSTAVITRLRTHFARHGIPSSLRTDNGPQFISDEFTNFLHEYGVQHRRNTPLWPRANGEVERQNRTLLKALRIAQLNRQPWQVELQRFLLAYRSTPHTTTGESPAKLLFGRELHTKLPSLELANQSVIPLSAARDNDSARKQYAKDYADTTNRAAESNLRPGDTVLLRNPQPANKLSSPYLPEPHTIIDRHGDQVVVARPDRSILKRNVTDTKPLLKEEKGATAATPDDATTAVTQPPTASTSDSSPSQPAGEKSDSPSVVPPAAASRPSRDIQPPARFKDYVTSFH